MEYATLIPAKEAVEKGPEMKGATKAQRFFPGLPEPGSANKKRLPLGLCSSRLYMLFATASKTGICREKWIPAFARMTDGWYFL